MILYHFTSRHHIDSVKRGGIVRGVLPVPGVGIVPGFQWCTINPSFNQSWNVMHQVEYDRTEYRITIKIPKKHQKRVFNWLEFCNGTTIDFGFLNTYGDPENWRLYQGRIKPGWFRQIDLKGGSESKKTKPPMSNPDATGTLRRLVNKERS
jgi:hypothetical protein